MLFATLMLTPDQGSAGESVHVPRRQGYNTRLFADPRISEAIPMTIGWYPGHMHKARKDITKAIRAADAVIEIVDARLPPSSANPLLDTIIGATPRLKVLNKADLADAEVTTLSLDWYRGHGDRAVAHEESRTARVRTQAAQLDREIGKPENKTFRLIVLGIANGSSATLMSILLDGKVANVGKEPAVTRSRQEIR